MVVAKQVKKSGRPPSAGIPSREELVRLYVKEKKTLRDISGETGCPKDTLHRALRRYKIPIRARGKVSPLSSIRLRSLEKKIEKKGLRETARDLGTSHVTLLRHVGRRSKRALK